MRGIFPINIAPIAAGEEVKNPCEGYQTSEERVTNMRIETRDDDRAYSRIVPFRIVSGIVMICAGLALYALYETLRTHEGIANPNDDFFFRIGKNQLANCKGSPDVFEVRQVICYGGRMLDREVFDAATDEEAEAHCKASCIGITKTTPCGAIAIEKIENRYTCMYYEDCSEMCLADNANAWSLLRYLEDPKYQVIGYNTYSQCSHTFGNDRVVRGSVIDAPVCAGTPYNTQVMETFTADEGEFQSVMLRECMRLCDLDSRCMYISTWNSQQASSIAIERPMPQNARYKCNFYQSCENMCYMRDPIDAPLSAEFWPLHTHSIGRQAFYKFNRL